MYEVEFEALLEIARRRIFGHGAESGDYLEKFLGSKQEPKKFLVFYCGCPAAVGRGLIYEEKLPWPERVRGGWAPNRVPFAKTPANAGEILKKEEKESLFAKETQKNIL